MTNRSLTADFLWDHSVLCTFILSQWEYCSLHSSSLVSNVLLINALGSKAHSVNNWLSLKGIKEVQDKGRRVLKTH